MCRLKIAALFVPEEGSICETGTGTVLDKTTCSLMQLLFLWSEGFCGVGDFVVLGDCLWCGIFPKYVVVNNTSPNI